MKRAPWISAFAFGILLLAPPGLHAAPAAKPDPAPAAEKARSDFQSQTLLAEIDAILKRTSEEREAAKGLPSEKRFVLPPIWRETREDRQASVRRLLDGALEIITDAPVLKLQGDLQKRRDEIAALRARRAELRERRIAAPQSGFLPGVLSETQASIDSDIANIEGRIAEHEKAIVAIKAEIGASIAKAGVTLSEEQVSLLLDSVLGGDLLKLVAAFEVARLVDQRLGTLLAQTNEDLNAARRYFAMHAALFALLVHAQDILLEKIDLVYLPRLDGILAGIGKTRGMTDDLLSAKNRPDQKRILEANRRSQDAAQKVAAFYRDYLVSQRRLLNDTRERTLHDLAIADNTYETVEASFQLRTLMNEARTSFEALQSLETPGFDQIFENEDLKREFENLTQRLSPAS